MIFSVEPLTTVFFQQTPKTTANRIVTQLKPDTLSVQKKEQASVLTSFMQFGLP